MQNRDIDEVKVKDVKGKPLIIVEVYLAFPVRKYELHSNKVKWRIQGRGPGPLIFRPN